MRKLIFLKLLSLIATSGLVYGRLTRSTSGLALVEPQFLPGTISTLIQTARKIIGSNVEPESVIGEGISQINASDSEKLYEEAVSSAMSVYQKGMNDAAHNRLKQKEAVSSMPVVANTREPACSVMISGELSLALDPKNIFDVDLLGFKITKNDLLFMTDIKNPETLIRNYSLDKIEAPLESVQNSRKCFRMYYEGNPIVMCAKSDESRNEMMNKITEAVSLIFNYIYQFDSLNSNLNKIGILQE
ncbi:hypothetical protein FG379_000796 [Cryptosporidium bovis]|uniref:uncharacterized protein n=1 Tax=Cryptosporidium bovis TaxID=310047 RepID=UPI00351A5300|nr:hypothetical protein FG379_000796 [Cryptosporidium bovis]